MNSVFLAWTFSAVLWGQNPQFRPYPLSSQEIARRQEHIIRDLQDASDDQKRREFSAFSQALRGGQFNRALTMIQNEKAPETRRMMLKAMMHSPQQAEKYHDLRKLRRLVQDLDHDNDPHWRAMTMVHMLCLPWPLADPTDRLRMEALSQSLQSLKPDYRSADEALSMMRRTYRLIPKFVWSEAQLLVVLELLARLDQRQRYLFLQDVVENSPDAFHQERLLRMLMDFLDEQLDDEPTNGLAPNVSPEEKKSFDHHLRKLLSNNADLVYEALRRRGLDSLESFAQSVWRSRFDAEKWRDMLEHRTTTLWLKREDKQSELLKRATKKSEPPLLQSGYLLACIQPIKPNPAWAGPCLQLLKDDRELPQRNAVLARCLDNWSLEEADAPWMWDALNEQPDASSEKLWRAVLQNSTLRDALFDSVIYRSFANLLEKRPPAVQRKFWDRLLRDPQLWERVQKQGEISALIRWGEHAPTPAFREIYLDALWAREEVQGESLLRTFQKQKMQDRFIKEVLRRSTAQQQKRFQDLWSLLDYSDRILLTDEDAEKIVKMVQSHHQDPVREETARLFRRRLFLRPMLLAAAAYAEQTDSLQKLVEQERVPSQRRLLLARYYAQPLAIWELVQQGQTDSWIDFLLRQASAAERAEILIAAFSDRLTAELLMRQKRFPLLLALARKKERGNAPFLRPALKAILVSEPVVRWFATQQKFDQWLQIVRVEFHGKEFSLLRTLTVSRSGARPLTTIVEQGLHQELIEEAGRLRDDRQRRWLLSDWFADPAWTAALAGGRQFAAVFSGLPAKDRWEVLRDLCRREDAQQTMFSTSAGEPFLQLVDQIPHAEQRRDARADLLAAPAVAEYWRKQNSLAVVRRWVKEEPEETHRRRFLTHLLTHSEAVSGWLENGQLESVFAAIDAKQQRRCRLELLHSPAAIEWLSRQKTLQALLQDLQQEPNIDWRNRFVRRWRKNRSAMEAVSKQERCAELLERILK